MGRASDEGWQEKTSPSLVHPLICADDNLVGFIKQEMGIHVLIEHARIVIDAAPKHPSLNREDKIGDAIFHILE